MRTFTQLELKEILELHKQWLDGEENGKKANLDFADLRNATLFNADLRNASLGFANLNNANLSNANLFNANLGFADLFNANLYKADLNNANLNNANLRKANLYKADLSNANLSNANLYKANLRKATLYNADLSNANLSNANLYKADLSNADLSNTILPKDRFIFQGNNKHQIIAEDGYIKIGCKRMKAEEWISSFEKIGTENGYTKEEIADYGDFIKWYLRRHTHTNLINRRIYESVP